MIKYYWDILKLSQLKTLQNHNSLGMTMQFSIPLNKYNSV